MLLTGCKAEADQAEAAAQPSPWAVQGTSLALHYRHAAVVTTTFSFKAWHLLTETLQPLAALPHSCRQGLDPATRAVWLYSLSKMLCAALRSACFGCCLAAQ